MNNQIIYYVKNMETNEEIEILFPVNDINAKLNEIGLTSLNRKFCNITGNELNISAVEKLYLKEVLSECATDYDEIIKTNSAIKLLYDAWQDQIGDVYHPDCEV